MAAGLRQPSLSGVWAAIEAGLGVTVRTTVAMPSRLAVLDPSSAQLPKLPVVSLCPRGSQARTRRSKHLKKKAGRGFRELRRAAGRHRQGHRHLAPTMRAHYADILDTAAVKANSLVAQSLFAKATRGEGSASVTAAIFWLKTRARWRERDIHEITVLNGGPIHTIDLSSLTDTQLAALDQHHGSSGAEYPP